ncbi:MAG TPA: pur operon repressor [Atopostipes sp.]|nr:pur operon repressor [Atopostipes sp.]
MKVKRSERLVEMAIYFLQNPNTITPLNYFSEKFQSAKSSISEDLTIIKHSFEENNMGSLVTYAGARGGVQYQPHYEEAQLEKEILKIKDEINGSKRLLPGGYIYTSDLLSDPKWLKRIGKVIASKYISEDVDTIMTIATKGVPIAQAVAYNLNVPFVIVRKSSKVTEGPTVSINYLPRSSSEQVEKMELSKRSLQEESKVLIIDDFLRGGGTVTGLKSMAEEFNCEVVDSVVLLEHNGKAPVGDYRSLLKVKSVDEETDAIEVDLGNFISI